MSSSAYLLTQTQSLTNSDPKRAEQIYRDILNAFGNDVAANTDDASKEQALRNQETALIKLGELYRDHRCVPPLPDKLCNLMCWTTIHRNPQGLAEVIMLSRVFISSTAKAKTAKLSA